MYFQVLFSSLLILRTTYAFSFMENILLGLFLIIINAQSSSLLRAVPRHRSYAMIFWVQGSIESNTAGIAEAPHSNE